VKLILLESVYGLGRPGDEVNVKAGYARNFLVPQRKAVRHSADTVRLLDKLRRKAKEEERAMISSMQELAGKLEGFAVQVQARATDEGHLFGSVTEKDIQFALEAAGWDVPQRAVRLPAHLKDAGEQDVELHLHGEIRAMIKVDVVPVDAEGQPIELTTAAEETSGDESATEKKKEEGEDDTPVSGEPAAIADA